MATLVQPVPEDWNWSLTESMDVGDGGTCEIWPYDAVEFAMTGFVLGVQVRWTTRDPTTNTGYPGGAPYPSPYWCLGPVRPDL